VSDTQQPLLYNFDDLRAGRCTFDQVGTPKLPEPEPPETPEPPLRPEQPPSTPLPDLATLTDQEIAATGVRLLREATIEVFHRVGAAEWLHGLACNNPKEFLKMLQRLLPQTIEATVAVQPFEVPKNIRDLSIEDLKAMRQQPGFQPASTESQIIDVAFTEVPR